MRIRLIFKKTNYLKYIGHLDLMKVFQRAFNRAELPIKYSQGFNPQPRISIANPLSLGIEGLEEYMDLEVTEEIPVQQLIERANSYLPEDIQILSGQYVEDKRPIASLINEGTYIISFKSLADQGSQFQILPALEKWLGQDEIIIMRKRKRRRKRVLVEANIRPLIKSVELLEDKEGKHRIQASMSLGEEGNLRVFDFMSALIRDCPDLAIDPDSISYQRRSLGQ